MSASGGITVYQNKWWNDKAATELLDPSDLDAAGEPIFAFDANSVGTGEIYAPGVLALVAGLGGPGLRATYTVVSDFVVQAGFNLAIATVKVPGVQRSDVIEVSPLPLVDLLIAGCCLTNGTVTLNAFNFTGANVTLLANRVLQVITYST